MAETAEKGMVAGMYHAFIMFRDSVGYPMGQLATPDAPVQLTVYSPYKIPGIVGWVPPVPASEIATRRGGQKVLGARRVGISSLGQGQLTLSDYDETFLSLIGGSTIDVATHTEHAMSSMNSQEFDIPQLFLMLVAGFQNDVGTNKFLTGGYINVQIDQLDTPMSQNAGDNPNGLVFNVTPSVSLRMPTGMLFSASALAVQDDKDINWRDHNSENAGIWIDTYIDDGIATTFTLTYRPLSTDATNITNIVTKEGIATAPTTIVDTTGVVTITPGTADDIWVVTYPTNYIVP